MRKSRASFSFTSPISGPPLTERSSLSLSGVSEGVEGVKLFLLGIFLGELEG